MRSGLVLRGLISWVFCPDLQDEVFHIPQVVRYCQHNFSYWDPMITTLPGLSVATSATYLLPSELLLPPALSSLT